MEKECLSNEEYVEKDGGVCPFCLSDNIRGGDFDMGDTTVYLNVICKACGAEWTDEYNLTGFEVVCGPDK